ncbi:MAG: type II secretion system F family protein [Candidatus Bathyarchaeota archaeon]|nr:type II secretion system F family protein [Candidatus Bathyarchaeota archaeon]MDH5495543.1 type II secretion system F family protein [Candidatus Bathyarchaeota archaeon]
MNVTHLKKSINQIRQRVVKEVRLKVSAFLNHFSQSAKNTEQTKWNPQLFAYRLLGERANRFLPLFRDMDTGLHKSGMRISFKPYVSLTLLTSLIITVSTMVLVPPIMYFILQIALFPSLFFGVGGGLLVGALTVVCFYIYPIYRADNIRRNLDDSMSFATGYLAILAGAGVPPNNMFRSLSKIPQNLAVIDESRIIVRDVELFGADVITALENASKRTPSEKFRELLEGFVATIHSGGNLMSYLMNRSRQNMKYKRIALRKFSDTLEVLSEFYVTLLVAGPLIFVVMLAVMAMLGGSGLGILDPTLLLMLLTYIVIPIGSVIFITILDALSPRW